MVTRAPSRPRSAPARRPPARRPPARRPRARRQRRSGRLSGLLSSLFRGLGRLARGTWMVFAHLIGGGFRAAGARARDLDPAHRRDGAGLGVLAAALVIAGGVWWRLPGPIGFGACCCGGGRFVFASLVFGRVWVLVGGVVII